MKDVYKNWIEEHYPTIGSAYGHCQEAVQLMKEAFPELEVTNGFAITSWGDREHWWLKDSEGNVVDPTAHQFVLFGYEEIDDTHPARNYPRRRCMDCGEYYYQTPELDGIMHTKACEKSYAAYINGGPL